MHRRFPALTLAALMAVGATAGWGQTASQLTPQSFEPQAQRPTGPVVLSGRAGGPVPAGADRLFVRLSDVVVEDALPEMAAAGAALRGRLAGQVISAAEIFKAASALEADYAKAGFVLARVVLPPQTLNNGGTLRLQVINGFVENVDVTNVPGPVRNRVSQLSTPLVGRKALRLSDIERRLLLAGDTFGLSLGSSLIAGEDPGSTRVLLDAEFRPVTAFVGLDDTLGADLGTYSFSSGVEVNGALKMGETFYGRLSGNPSQLFDDLPRYRTAALGFVLPLGGNGLTLNVEGTSSKSTPDTAFAPTTSDFERLSVRLFYPWIRSRDLNLSSQVSLDRQSDKQFLLLGASRVGLYHDELSVLRASLDGMRRNARGGVFEGALSLSQGLDGLGARDGSTGLPLSRQGAAPDFSKLVIAGRYTQPLNEKFLMVLSGRAQTAFGDALPNSERLGIVGASELSSFDAGKLQGDSGWVVRGEVLMPRPVTVGAVPLQMSPYVFGAYGQVNNARPTAVEAARIRASSVGLGVKFDYQGGDPFTSGSLRIELGKGARDDNGPDGYRIAVLANYRF
ncbi:ShlB/FhaC/HecB family hemolysin secretion/activation protein [Phaeovulum sp. W22_SRMD_FR3]|uniref:ShlB/FhaC/HecB family hemolysin secretion/activation protein n=1 Tax=Phaeovulum sp. W22_SRMD_FR3 TaxID=3240274 RepID=UPI003F9784B7